jgi:surface protein
MKYLFFILGLFIAVCVDAQTDNQPYFAARAEVSDSPTDQGGGVYRLTAIISDQTGVYIGTDITADTSMYYICPSPVSNNDINVYPVISIVSAFSGQVTVDVLDIQSTGIAPQLGSNVIVEQTADSLFTYVSGAGDPLNQAIQGYNVDKIKKRFDGVMVTGIDQDSITSVVYASDTLTITLVSGTTYKAEIVDGGGGSDQDSIVSTYYLTDTLGLILSSGDTIKTTIKPLIGYSADAGSSFQLSNGQFLDFSGGYGVATVSNGSGNIDIRIDTAALATVWSLGDSLANITTIDTIGYLCASHVTANMAVYKISSTQVDTASARDTIAAELFVVKKYGGICYCANNGTSLSISGLSDGSYYLGDSGNLTTTKPTEKHQFIGTVLSNGMSLNIGDFFLNGVNTTNDELTTYYEQPLNPTDQKIGDLWWKTTTDSVFIYNGNRWQFVNTKGGCPVVNVSMSATPVIDLGNRDCATFVLDLGFKDIYELSVTNPKKGGRYIFDFRNVLGTKKDVVFPSTFTWENMKILDALTITETAEMVRFSYDGAVFRAFEPEKANGFVTTWRTQNTTGSFSDSLTIQLPLQVSGTHSFLINWGDGNTEFILDDSMAIHTYADTGTYRVSLYGTIETFGFNNSGDKTKLITVESYGPLTLTSAGGAFYGCSNLESVPLDQAVSGTPVTLTDIFNGCAALDSVSLSGWDLSLCTSLQSAFADCSALKYIDIGNPSTPLLNSLSFSFRNCSSLTELNLSNLDIANVTNFTRTFEGCSSLSSLNLIGWITSSSATVMSRMFSGCSSLTFVDVSGFNTGNVTLMDQMFNGCSSLASLDVSNFNTSSVTNFYNMFAGCNSLNSLDVSGFTTTSATLMNRMFNDCDNLTTLDVSNFNTSLVTNMSSMFEKCDGLTVIDVSGFNTTNVENFSKMFANCIGLDSIDVSGFDMGSATNISSMFSAATNLRKIGDITTWDVAGVANMGGVFNACNTLDGSNELDFDQWDVSNVTSLLNFLGSGVSVGMTTANYDAMLIAWDALTLQSGVTADFGGSQYTLGGAAETARTNIITNDSWSIDDNGGL